ncbi:hypothetical protein [Methylobacterium sp. A54F]
MAPRPNMVTALQERPRPSAWTFRATQGLGVLLVILVLDAAVLDWRMCREVQAGSRQLHHGVTQAITVLRLRVGWW